MAFNQIASAWGRLTGRYAERANGERLVTEDMCRRRHDVASATAEKDRAGVDRKIEDLRLENKNDFKGVHSRIDDVMGAVRGLDGTIKTMLTLRKN